MMKLRFQTNSRVWKNTGEQFHSCVTLPGLFQSITSTASSALLNVSSQRKLKIAQSMTSLHIGSTCLKSEPKCLHSSFPNGKKEPERSEWKMNNKDFLLSVAAGRGSEPRFKLSRLKQFSSAQNSSGGRGSRALGPLVERLIAWKHRIGIAQWAKSRLHHVSFFYGNHNKRFLLRFTAANSLRRLPYTILDSLSNRFCVRLRDTSCSAENAQSRGWFLMTTPPRIGRRGSVSTGYWTLTMAFRHFLFATLSDKASQHDESSM